ncbi:MAG: glutamate racemase [Clostridiales bacterium]|nr:glutamate racemase [Clostridiales bacterium]
MDHRPVGIMDSGLGGISVLGEVLRVLPNENFVYYGDTSHIPYGDKPPEKVFAYAHQAVDQLIEQGCKAVVIACNTATSVAAARLRQELTLPVIGMEPALKPAAMMPGQGRILVMATHVTLTQPKFQSLMQRYGQDAIPLPCPGLMECVEAGQMSGPRVDRLLDTLLAPYQDTPIKAVVLGCTHYPFLRGAIAAHLPPGTPLIDGSLGTARQLKRRLQEENLASDGPGGQVTFLSSMAGQQPITQMQRLLDWWRQNDTGRVAAD